MREIVRFILLCAILGNAWLVWKVLCLWWSQPIDPFLDPPTKFEWTVAVALMIIPPTALVLLIWFFIAL